MSNKKLILKKSAPDEIEISLGIEYHRKFKRDQQPFTVETRIADSLLRSYDEFEEFSDPKTKEPVINKPETKTAALPPNTMQTDEKTDEKADLAQIALEPGEEPVITNPNTQPPKVVTETRK